MIYLHSTQSVWQLVLSKAGALAQASTACELASTWDIPLILGPQHWEVLVAVHVRMNRARREPVFEPMN